MQKHTQQKQTTKHKKTTKHLFHYKKEASQDCSMFVELRSEYMYLKEVFFCNYVKMSYYGKPVK